jgi:heme/copper-type cytochrome/quinol oxidase subunit 2
MTPALILCAIGAPSFALLYGIDELNQPEVTLKGIGHQGHWCYEYSDFLGTPDFWLLQTRNSWETHLVLPLESLVVQEAELESPQEPEPQSKGRPDLNGSADCLLGGVTCSVTGRKDYGLTQGRGVISERTTPIGTTRIRWRRVVRLGVCGSRMRPESPLQGSGISSDV